MAVLIAGGWYWYSSAAQSSQGQVVQPIAVTRGNIEEVVTAQGKLEAKQYVDVGTQVSGQLKAIHVDIGDTVTKGQLLAEIDPRVYQAQVEAGEARLNSLRAQLNQQKAEAVLAEQNLKRNQNLIAVNAVSQQALQETESQAAVARAQVDSILAQMQETESNLKGEPDQSELHKNLRADGGHRDDAADARKGRRLNANQTAPMILQIANLDMHDCARPGGRSGRRAASRKTCPPISPPSAIPSGAGTGTVRQVLADAADRQRSGALRCLDRCQERRPPAHDRHDDPGVFHLRQGGKRA